MYELPWVSLQFQVGVAADVTDGAPDTSIPPRPRGKTPPDWASDHVFRG